MMKFCEACQNTGETIPGSGDLDCIAPGCTAATERTALNEWLRKNSWATGMREWAIYRRGGHEATEEAELRIATLTEEKAAAEQRAFDLAAHCETLERELADTALTIREAEALADVKLPGTFSTPEELFAAMEAAQSPSAPEARAPMVTVDTPEFRRLLTDFASKWYDHPGEGVKRHEILKAIDFHTAEAVALVQRELSHAQMAAVAEARLADEFRERAEKAEHGFKNFHRSLCERFGYVHDDADWFRDQVSLEEHIAKQIPAPDQPGDGELPPLPELSFDGIEDSFPEGGSVHDDGQITVSAAWLHQFARNLAARQPAPAALPAIPTDDMCRAAREQIGIGSNVADRAWRIMAAAFSGGAAPVAAAVTQGDADAQLAEQAAVSYQQGRAAGIEEAAKLVEQHQETNVVNGADGVTNERAVTPRKAHNLMGLAYAAAIRALNK